MKTSVKQKAAGIKKAAGINSRRGLLELTAAEDCRNLQ